MNGHPPPNPAKARPHILIAEDGMSTESDAESVYQGWSDAGGWNASPASSQPRASISSGEEDRHSSPDGTTTLAVPTPFSHRVASGPQRRSSTARPALHSANSDISVESYTPGAPPPYPSNVLNMGQISSPVAMNEKHANGNNEAASSSSYNSHAARSRRKSISQPAHGVISTESEEEVDGYPTANGGLHTKGKRRKSRGASFSLPFHRGRRRMSNAAPPWIKVIEKQGRRAARFLSPRLIGLILLLLLSALLCVRWWKANYEVQFEYSIFSRRWVRREIDTIHPLKGCWEPKNISPQYNLTKHLAPKHQMLNPGTSLRRGMSCYDFSATIQPIPGMAREQTTYHTYWRSDLIPFGERQSATLTAFLATQPLAYSKLVIWTNGADIVSANEHVKKFLVKWGRNIEVRQVDMKYLTRGTELEGVIGGNDNAGLFDARAWVDGDAVRLLVLWHYGGIWMDMDQVLTRDLHPLTETEFVTQWDCYDKEYFTLNGALMHFEKHSPYLCEAFHIMASSPLPRPNTFSWGSFLYSKLHRRLLSNRIKPFSILPWCFADPRNCRDDISFPDPFLPDPEYWNGRKWDGRGEIGKSGREMLEDRIGHIWTVHLHNQWGKSFPGGGWVDNLFKGYNEQLEEIERRAVGVGSGQVVVTEEMGIDPMVGMGKARHGGAGTGAKDQDKAKAIKMQKELEEAELQRELRDEGERERDKEAALSQQFKVW